MAGYQQLHARSPTTVPALQRERTNLPSGAGQKIMTQILMKTNEIIIIFRWWSKDNDSDSNEN